MPISIYVAADICGQKHNLDLEFPLPPTVPDLIRQAEAAFTAELAARRPGSPPFQVSKMQVVNEETDVWSEVVSPHQLHHQCQVYAFQPHSTRYTEAQGHIPPAVKPRMGFRPSPSPSPTPLAHAAFPAAGSPLAPATGLSQLGGARPVPGGLHFAPPPSALAATGLPPVRTLPDNAPHDDKVRIVFEELDANSNRVIETDELRRGLRTCALDLTAATFSDLFRKADVDSDGVVSFAEWQRFAELYPTLLDCLYYRFKAHWEHVAQEQQVDQQRGMRAALEEAERIAQAMYAQAQLAAEEAARRLNETDRSAAEAASRQRAAEDAARDGTRDVDCARQQRMDRERDLAAERERERQSQSRAQDSARELDAAQRSLASAQAQLSEYEAAEHRAAQVLADARRDRERQQGLTERAMVDAQRAAERHNQLLSELPRGVEDAAGRLSQADRELAAADQRARELFAKAQEAMRMAEEAARARDSQGMMLQESRDAQEPARLAWLDAQRALEEHDRRVAELEAALAADAEARRQLEDQERGLVEQELRLREQREMLEEKEGALRSAHQSFFQAAGRSSPGRVRPSAQLSGGVSPRMVVSSSSYAAHSASASASFSHTRGAAAHMESSYRQ
eukprot:TRINITY_DN307_c1_g1_i1.p1 TRINITY_DN307_c1_g1~~TRINITY_DN307_c1_g1_i1.p1  ORF type:complete len:654 (+),score=259.48 TRINITY_DN307_c1_g1_i1:92-1963(+)